MENIIQQIALNLAKEITKGALSADHFKPGEAHKKYSEYADKLIAENIGGAVDWSLFDVERTTFDLASGTQIKIHGLSRINNTLFS